MNQISWILCLILIYANNLASLKTKCTGVHINGKNHKKEILANGINRPYQLAYYHHKNVLYFSYNVGDDNQDKFEIGYFNLKENKKIPTPIPIKNGFATALDENNKLLYLGGTDGVFVANLNESAVIEHVIKGHNIWDMFFKNHLYFIEYPSQRLHKKTQNGSEIVAHIHEKIYQFVIDGNDDIFITTKDGVREIKNGTSEKIPYDGPAAFRAVEVDRKGVAHFCAKSSIYVANKENHTLEEIGHVKNIFGITFGNDNNIIYSDPHEIVKLLPEDCK